jgi:hypothetical protein
MDSGIVPCFVVWDITYACPLRCTHCYSESGRRESRQLGSGDLYRVADALISLRPPGVVLSGGEPLVVKEVFGIAERISKSGIEVHIYTSGWELRPPMIPLIMRWFSRVTVSIDGATASIHDHIRGRVGSYERATRALTHLDAAVGARRRSGEMTPSLGIDFVVMQSNFGELREMCAAVVPRFPQLEFISFGAVVPSGLATRLEFGEQELLSEEQAGLLDSGQLAQDLQSLVPATVEVRTSANWELQMHPDRLASGSYVPEMQVEPDGRVRALPIYEGTVGSLLYESPLVVWERAVERWTDPFVLETLTPARTMRAWAEAARRLDLHFGAAEDQTRIARRPLYSIAAAV